MKMTPEITTWDRVKEAVRRDWEQSKHDFHLPGGHELNQSAADTIKQATNREPIPNNDRPNPPKVIGSWTDAEVPIRFGYDARQRYGEPNAQWSQNTAERLRAEWEQRRAATDREWDEVQSWIRHGYEYRPKS